jgi:hypothetical protein
MRKFIILLLLLSGPALWAGVVISNPSFEQGCASSICSFDTSSSPPGWTVISGNIEFVNGSFWPPEQGSYSVDTDGTAPGAISQDLSGFVVNQMYQLTFGLAFNPSWCSSSALCELEVAIGGVTKDYWVGEGAFAWVDQSISFIASSTTTTLVFTDVVGQGSGGPAIDNVRIAGGVPEPSTVGLLLLGVGTLLLARRRRA